MGESWIRVLTFNVFHSIRASWALVRAERPELLLSNGPGTAVPLFLAAHLSNFLARLHVRRSSTSSAVSNQCRMLFVESFARVKSLSLTGQMLYAMDMFDRFVVQWPALERRYPSSTLMNLFLENVEGEGVDGIDKGK